MANETKCGAPSSRVFSLMVCNQTAGHSGNHRYVVQGMQVEWAQGYVSDDAGLDKPQPSLSAAVETLEKAKGEIVKLDRDLDSMLMALPASTEWVRILRARVARLHYALQQLQGVPETPETRVRK